MNYADLLDLPKQIQWRIRDSNAGQAAYESAALPTELMRRAVFTIHSLAGNGSTSLGLMNPLLCRLSYRAMRCFRFICLRAEA